MPEKSNPDPTYIRENAVLIGKAKNTLSKDDIKNAFKRIVACDWGEVNKFAWLQNDMSYKNGGVISSVFTSESGCRFRIVTGEDRKSFVLLCENHLKKAC